MVHVMAISPKAIMPQYDHTLSQDLSKHVHDMEVTIAEMEHREAKRDAEIRLLVSDVEYWKGQADNAMSELRALTPPQRV